MSSTGDPNHIIHLFYFQNESINNIYEDKNFSELLCLIPNKKKNNNHILYASAHLTIIEEKPWNIVYFYLPDPL